MDGIDIRLALCAVPGVEREFLLPRRPYPYIRRQHAVQSAFDIHEGNTFDREKINDLTKRMDSCIGATRTVHLHRMVDDPFNGAPYNFLYRHAVGLALPSVIMGPFILDDQGYISRTVCFHMYPVPADK
jgi:hypothetical protein